METEVITTAVSIEAALELALAELDAEEEEVEVEVLEEPAKKLFGANTEAKIRVWLKAEPGEEQSETQEEPEDAEDADPEEQDEPYDASPEGSDSDGSLGGQQYYPEDDEKNYNEAMVELSEEELDVIADAAIDTIRGFLEYFGAEDTEIDEYEGEEGELILDIIGDNLAVLIGRHGKTLDAIQSLVSSIVSKKTGYRHPVVVDVKGYKHRRKQKIVGIARASAARAIRQKHEVRLRPMTPYERRIVHVALRDDKRVKTSSEGIEPNRYVVIQLL